MNAENANLNSLDWDAVREQLRRRMGGRLDQSEGADLDDLVQEGCLRLLRIYRREKVEDQDALIGVIADRTFKDHLRRRYRNERRWNSLTETHLEIADRKGVAEDLFGHAVERLEFAVMAIFSSRGKSECEHLARNWFAQRNWKELAEEENVSHQSLRKRWSRCLELPKRILRADPDFRHLFGLR